MATPRQRTYPGFEFLERKGFGQIVIGTQIERRDAFLDAIECRQDEHRDKGAASAQALERVQPIHLRQTEIEYQQIELASRDRSVSLDAVLDPIHRVAGPTQRAHQPVGQDRIVLGNEYPHATSSPCAAGTVYPSRGALTCCARALRRRVGD